MIRRTYTQSGVRIHSLELRNLSLELRNVSSFAGCTCDAGISSSDSEESRLHAPTLLSVPDVLRNDSLDLRNVRSTLTFISSKLTLSQGELHLDSSL